MHKLFLLLYCVFTDMSLRAFLCG